ncbi:GIY-YIG nuclease family protein [Streptomyces rishiriensis]|uniref:GIY-YIG nuclease family protein n=1 Tax=Streptomyces rishiriensis TaxID=68264 RepID=UPI000D5A1DD3|nr:GIY-YIG nuclease family protein [Streptomyces rishiriensis]
MRDELAELPESGEVIYIVEYSFDAVKVGYTSQPRRRLQAHIRSARQLGMEATRFWTSEPHVNARMNERRLIKFCSERSERTTGAKQGEYFASLNLDDVREFAQTLQFEPPIEKPAVETECPACAVVDARPLSALALLHEIAHGNLRIFDSAGRDVSAAWVGSVKANH